MFDPKLFSIKAGRIAACGTTAWPLWWDGLTIRPTKMRQELDYFAAATPTFNPLDQILRIADRIEQLAR